MQTRASTHMSHNHVIEKKEAEPIVRIKETRPKPKPRKNDTPPSHSSVHKNDNSDSSSYGRSPRVAKFTDEDLRCELTGARDPLTGRPMKRPAMSPDGYVMDLDSWKKIMSGKKEMPFDSSIQSLSELTLVTAKTYEDLRLNIVNIPT